MNKKIEILIIVAAVFIGLNFFKNGIVQAALEGALSQAAHVPVHIGRTHARFLAGSIDLRNIQIANPHSFPDKTMLVAPQVSIVFDPMALRHQTAHFKEVRINLKELTVIKNRDGQLNIDAVKPKKEEKNKQEAPAKKGPSIRLKIDVLHLTIGRVLYKDYSGGGAPSVQTFDVNIQDRVYQNIENPTALVSLIMLETLRNTTLARIANLDLGSFKNGAEGIISGGLGYASGGLGYASDKGSGIVDEGSEAVEKTAKNIFGIFK